MPSSWAVARTAGSTSLVPGMGGTTTVISGTPATTAGTPIITSTLGKLPLPQGTNSPADGIGRCVVRNLERMGVMGRDLVDHLRQRHPELPIRSALGGSGDPWEHLPPPSPRVEALIARYG